MAVCSVLAWSAPASADDASKEPAAAPAEIDDGALFAAATKALAEDRAGEAITGYEALGDRGVLDPVLSFDRGLAYAARVRAGAGAEQPGDLGRAAHGFEEARELSADARLGADAAAALAAVRAEVARRRSRAGDPVEIESGISIGRSIARLLPENAWAILAALASLAMSVGIVLRARATARRAAVTGTTTTVVAAAALCLTALALHTARDARLALREAVVIAPGARLLDDKRVAMSSVAPLAEGARVQLVDESGDFSRVSAGRLSGWLPKSVVLPMAKPR